MLQISEAQEATTLSMAEYRCCRRLCEDQKREAYDPANAGEYPK
jgi:hypothetical protein